MFQAVISHVFKFDRVCWCQTLEKIINEFQSFPGSMLESSEKSVSLVKGGRSEYAAALAWEKTGSFPEHTAYTNWLESTKDNPIVIDFEVRKQK